VCILSFLFFYYKKKPDKKIYNMAEKKNESYLTRIVVNGGMADVCWFDKNFLNLR
jgi:hypothetical protein